MIRNILVLLGVIAVLSGYCTTSAACKNVNRVCVCKCTCEKTNSALKVMEIMMEKHEKMRRTKLDKYQDLRFDKEAGYYTGRKGTKVYIVDIPTSGDVMSEGYDRIYAAHDLIIGERGGWKHLLDPVRHRSQFFSGWSRGNSEGYQKIYKREGLIIGERDGLKHLIDPMSKRPMDEGYREIYKLGELTIGEVDGLRYIIEPDPRGVEILGWLKSDGYQKIHELNGFLIGELHGFKYLLGRRFANSSYSSLSDGYKKIYCGEGRLIGERYDGNNYFLDSFSGREEEKVKKRN